MGFLVKNGALETKKMETKAILQEKFPSKEVLLDLQNLKKVYPTPNGDYVVLEDLNLQVKKEEFITIIGHSGCGKTTMLSMIAGLNEISDGKISVLGSSIKGPGPDRGVIFQSPSLMPWMTALENVATPMELAGAADARTRAEAELQAVGLGHPCSSSARPR